MQTVSMILNGNVNRPKWPVWAAINFDYDRSKALSEAESLSNFFINLPPHFLTVKNHRNFWPIAPEEWYKQIGYWSKETGLVEGIRPTWRGVNLTTTSQIDAKDARSGANRVQGLFRGKWEWSELADKVPYLRSLAEALPFEYFDIARIMTISKEGFGPIHVDKPEGEREHSDKGFMGLTLQISDGEVPMQIKSRSGVRHNVNSPAFLFLDTVPHGVENPNSLRITFRIYGKIKPVELQNMLDMKTAIW